MTRFEKIKIALTYYCLGKGYKKAIEAISFAEKYHTGFRKDGDTPEFQHQIEIALFITTLKDLDDEESCIIIAILHDVQEDYNVQSSVISQKFGTSIANSVWAVTKVFDNAKKSMDFYMLEIANDKNGSIVKGADRVNNLSTMNGVFTREKQLSYSQEATELFLPMLKLAQKNFPSQHLAYMNIRTMLKTQIFMIQ